MGKLNNLHNLLLYLYAFSLSFEYWDWGIGGFSISKIVAIIYIIFSFLNIRSFNYKRFISKQIIPLLLFVTFLMLSYLLNSNKYYMNTPIINTALLYNIILLWFLTNHFAKNEKVAQLSLFSFALGGLLLSILYVNDIGLVYRQGRVSVFGDNPNNQGTKIAISFLIFLFYTIYDTLKLKKKRFFLLIPLPLFMQFIADTASRGALLTLLIGLFLIILFFKTNRIITKFISLLVGLVFFIIIYKWFLSNELVQLRMNAFIEEQSLGGREDIWKNVFGLFLNSPLFGIGENGFNKEMIALYGTNKSAHNLFLYALSTSGIIGFSFIFIYLYKTYIHALFLLRKNKQHLYIILYILVIFSMLRSGGSFGDKLIWFQFAIINGLYLFFYTKISNKKYYNENSMCN
ncbi:MAG: O-antigen ligase family protein [Petrimonas sp.]|nr:O-antigen ligase family protein [Petrimonas sp.]MEA5080301.1 O-antigen ligase family protein [Dysgonamonadaceae bacterium]